MCKINKHGWHSDIHDQSFYRKREIKCNVMQSLVCMAVLSWLLRTSMQALLDLSQLAIIEI